MFIEKFTPDYPKLFTSGKPTEVDVLAYVWSMVIHHTQIRLQVTALAFFFIPQFGKPKFSERRFTTRSAFPTLPPT